MRKVNGHDKRKQKFSAKSLVSCTTINLYVVPRTKDPGPGLVVVHCFCTLCSPLQDLNDIQDEMRENVGKTMSIAHWENRGVQKSILRVQLFHGHDDNVLSTS